MLAFLRLWLIEPSPWNITLTISLVFPISVLSWRYIEQPFRKGTIKLLNIKGRKGIFVASFISLISILGAGKFIISHQGFQNRLTAEQLEIFKIRDYERPTELYKMGTCFLAPNKATKYAADCTIKDANYAIWGDSHAGS